MPFSLTSFLHDALLSIKQRPFVHMAEPNKYIHGVIETDPFPRSIKSWFDFIAGTVPSHGDDGDRLGALQSCQVVRVEHYRARGLISHELVAVHVISGDDERVNQGNTDSRVLVLERSKQETSSETSIEQVLRSMREVKGKNTGNADYITIGSSLKGVIRGEDKYLLVQAFDVPPRIIDVIDIAALVNSITCCAKNYSLFHYMCMWWAAMFFQTCVRLCDPGHALKIEQGPLYSLRGMVGSVRFVDDDCSLIPLPPADTVTLSVIMKDIIRDMGQGGVDKDIITLFESVLEADIKAMKDENLGQPPVQHMLAACKTLSAGIRATLQSMKEKKRQTQT
ncbi:uncharacterized protein EV420DRAFT_1144732 [Desarmillaria tabescens]|uniref:Uncharacterized protein n=1 Tax=Armillaria tabescens TaxID=1929756 RepID=A0AA39TQF1_ARMTA|nr:uncharacterized protein EV420DRAFT_1144732 [Desarmillaria tabescens]KAK0462913.1 hypothetical protein EV420DRAFT_1144732 [Desarmillaria tabescens]